MGTSGLKRDAGKFGLLFASLGGMIGSGWLFGALNAAKIAGPASVISWVIGGFAVLLLAFVYAELTTMFPRPGAVIVFPKLCHGHLAAQIMSWINFLAYVSVAPVEAVAVVSYTNNYVPGLVVPASGVLTLPGLGAAVALMVFFIVINLLAIRLVLRINNAITWWKLFVPALTVVACRGFSARFPGRGLFSLISASVRQLSWRGNRPTRRRICRLRLSARFCCAWRFMRVCRLRLSVRSAQRICRPAGRSCISPAFPGRLRASRVCWG